MPFFGTRILCFGLALLSLPFFGANSDDAMGFQKNLPVQDVWAVIGKKAELPCDISPSRPEDKINMVLWFKDTEGIPLYSVDSRDGQLETAKHWAIDNDLGARTFFLAGGSPSRLIVTNVIEADQGIYRCRIDFVNSPTRNFKVNLTIVVPPATPVIYDTHGVEVTTVAGPFLEGFDLLLSCHVTGGQPRPKVSWWIGTTLLDAVSETFSSMLTVNQLFLPNVSRNMWNAKLACHARNSNLTAPVVKEIALELYLKPLKVRITSDVDLLSAGELHNYTCESSGSMPAARIIWLLDGETIRNADTMVSQGPNTTVSILTFQPGSEDDGKVLLCRTENPWFPGGIIEDRVRLNVAYPPIPVVKLGSSMDVDDLKEGDNIYLQCEIRANPEPTEVTWFHQGRKMKHNATSGTLMGDRSLLLKSIGREAGGEYVCSATNSDGEGRSEPVFLRVQFAPRCRQGVTSTQVGALRHETLTVKCEVEADPPVVKFSWTYNKTRDVLPVPGFRVTSSGLVSQLDYTPVSEMDYGTLACWASNGVGQQKKPCQFHVVPAKPPRPPVACILQNRSLGGLEVECRPGFDGGLPQHFVLEVTESRVPGDEMSTRKPLFRVLGAEPVFTLHNLEPARDYDIAIFAVNAKGRSDHVILSRVRILAMEKLTGRESSESQPLAIVLGVLIAAAALILGGVFAVAALVICRRRAGPRHDEATPQNDAALQAADTATPSDVTITAGSEDDGNLTTPAERFASDVATPQAAEDAPKSCSKCEVKNEPGVRVSRAELVLHFPSPGSAS